MENTNKDMKDHRMIILAPFIRQLKKTFTYETIALLLEVSRQTIYKWAHFDFEGEATKQAKKDVNKMDIQTTAEGKSALQAQYKLRIKELKNTH